MSFAAPDFDSIRTYLDVLRIRHEFYWWLIFTSVFGFFFYLILPAKTRSRLLGGPTARSRRWLVLGIALAVLSLILLDYSAPTPPIPPPGSSVYLSVAVTTTVRSVEVEVTTNHNNERFTEGGRSGVVRMDGMPGNSLIIDFRLSGKANATEKIIVSASSRFVETLLDDRGLAPTIFRENLGVRHPGSSSTSATSLAGELLYMSVAMDSQGHGRHTLIARESARTFFRESSGPHRAVALPRLYGLGGGTQLSFPNLPIKEIFYAPDSGVITIDQGDIAPFMNVTYANPPLIAPNRLRWTQKLNDNDSDVRYSFTDLLNTQRFGRLVFFSGTLAGLAGGFIIEGIKAIEAGYARGEGLSRGVKGRGSSRPPRSVSSRSRTLAARRRSKTHPRRSVAGRKARR